MTTQTLRTAQARVLAVLLPPRPDTPQIDWPSWSLQWIAERIGVSTKSDYIRRALRGLREGSPSGVAHDGLLKKGFVTQFELDVEGTTETHYVITQLGIEAIQAHLATNVLPTVKSAALCTNKRYTERNK